MAKKETEKEKKKKGRKGRLNPLKVNILTPEESKRVKEVCRTSNKPLRDSFAIWVMLAGGARIGEMKHIRKKNVDFKRKIIHIVAHEPCDCSYCFEQAKQRLDSAGKSKSEIENITDKEVRKMNWQPKSKASIRGIPYHFDDEFVQVIEKFFDKYDRFPLSITRTRERIDNIFSRAHVTGHTSQDLRKTAATNFAAKGATEYELMAIMGWSDPTVARKYVRLSGKIAWNFLKGNVSEKKILDDSQRVFYITEQGRTVHTRQKKRDEEGWIRTIYFGTDNSSQKGLFDAKWVDYKK